MAKDNIFDTAAKKLGHTKKGSAKSNPPHVYIDTELNEMLQQIRFMKEDLKNKFDQIMSNTGPKAELFQKMLQNKYSFTPEEWDKILLAKKLLGDKVWEAIGKKQGTENEQKPPEVKNRKGKTLGSRKKWIPMR